MELKGKFVHVFSDVTTNKKRYEGSGQILSIKKKMSPDNYVLCDVAFDDEIITTLIDTQDLI